VEAVLNPSTASADVKPMTSPGPVAETAGAARFVRRASVLLLVAAVVVAATCRGRRFGKASETMPDVTKRMIAYYTEGNKGLLPGRWRDQLAEIRALSEVTMSEITAIAWHDHTPPRVD